MSNLPYIDLVGSINYKTNEGVCDESKRGDPKGMNLGINIKWEIQRVRV